ncbi:hypothetical protein HDU98_008534 [Podochytrium sp. JEL0797]|nr:hypothetical protein HDU98_008534 [Podochytrium sp. JEL0797]
MQSEHGALLTSSSKAHEWSDTEIKAPLSSPFFEDQFGRKVHLRGVNMSGHSKLPLHSTSAFSTHLPGCADYFNHRDVSFIGRPFPLQDADEHFLRIKSWGLTFVRLLVTWEALEHKGPGIYDEEFIEYLIEILKKAEEHGIKCFIDPHQDTWSRFSGGSGAPGWTFEVAGMDLETFHDVGAAHVHNFNEKVTNPHQFWPTNYAKLACATMFTLFFGGEIFAPDALYEGVNVSTFLQDKYIACYAHLATRIQHCSAVVGFELMNEPHYGYIGLKNLKQFDPNLFLHYGKFPSPLQSFALGSGMAVDVDVYVHSFPVPTKKAGTRKMNVEKKSAWLKYGECVWKQHGVWEVDSSGCPKVLKPNYFTTDPKTGKLVDFYRDCYLPMMRKYTSAIHKVNPDYLMFFEPIPNEEPPILTESDRTQPNLVYSPHWYDLKALWSKSFDEEVTFDVQALARGANILNSIYFGRSGCETNYTGQMRRIMEAGKRNVGTRPVLMGECGIPMDFNQKRAYETGNYNEHNVFLDAVITSMEITGMEKISGLLQVLAGDQSLTVLQSIFSTPKGTPNGTPNIVSSKSFNPRSITPTSLTPPSSPPSKRNSTAIPTAAFEITDLSFPDEPLEGDPRHSQHFGGRALDAAVRPYAAKIAGTPLLSRFCLAKLTYTLEFSTIYVSGAPPLLQLLTTTNDPERISHTTEVFVPNFHFKADGFAIRVVVSDGEWKYDQEKQTLLWHFDPAFRGGSGTVKEGERVVHRLEVSLPGVVVAHGNKRGVFGYLKSLVGRKGI